MTSKHLSAIVPILFIAVGVLFVIYLNVRTNYKTDRNGETTRQNNSYLRVIACVSSVSPTKRTPEYVKYCYDRAEQSNGLKIERFGDGQETQ